MQERLQKLFAALGKEFDERIEGINLDETSAGFGSTANGFQGCDQKYPSPVQSEVLDCEVTASISLKDEKHHSGVAYAD